MIYDNLPDFETMMRVSEEISKLTRQKILLENEIKYTEARTVVEVTGNAKYFINNKPPSMAYISSTYLVTGLNNEIAEMRDELATIIPELELQKERLQIMRDMISLYQTESSNKRAGLV